MCRLETSTALIYVNQVHLSSFGVPDVPPAIRPCPAGAGALRTAMIVADAFDAARDGWPDHPFLHVLPETAGHYGIGPGPLTYADAAGEVDRLAHRYASAGYGIGHRVGLMLQNRPAMFLHWFALNRLGVSVVPLNPALRPAELSYLIQHSGMCLAVCAPHLASQLQAAISSVTGACPVIVVGETVPHTTIPSEGGTPDAQTECALLYTSGSTGRPKGCVLSNAYFLRCGHWYVGIGGLCTLRPGVERLITPLPMVHMNAMACSTLAMVLTGGCIVPLDGFHPQSWWQSVRDSGATVMHSLGSMPPLLLAQPPSPLDRTHAVRFGFAPGIDPRLHAAFEARFGMPMIDAWAMTETGGAAAIIAGEEPRLVGQSCFGRAPEQVSLRIVDDNGTEVPDGTPGELLVQAAGPDPRAGFFTEYLGDPAATQEAWMGGWFHTGDVVRRDAQGNLFFVDRRKNVIRRSGENISAAEVESVLRLHPLVRDVACTAAPDELRGEEVLACVVPNAPIADAARAAGDIVRFALADLARFKAPGFVTFVDALPLTATNKVQRGTLREWAHTLPGTPGCIDTRPLKRRP